MSSQTHMQQNCTIIIFLECNYKAKRLSICVLYIFCNLPDMSAEGVQNVCTGFEFINFKMCTYANFKLGQLKIPSYQIKVLVCVSIQLALKSVYGQNNYVTRQLSLLQHSTGKI